MSDTEDQPMEETEAQDDTEKAVEETEDKKKPRAFPLFLTCRLCTGLYKRAVKLACCKQSTACRACAVTNLAKNKKCWNPKCGKAALAADLINDDVTRAKVETNAVNEAKFKEDLKTGEILKCPVCEDICKRAVTLPCCGAAACRGCAVKKMAVKRGCWLEGCETIGVTGEELINDELLRSAIDNYKKEGVVDEEQARKIRQNKKQLMNKRNKKANKKTKAGRLISHKLKEIKKAKKDDAPNQRRDPPKEKVAEESQIATIDFYISGIPEETSKEDIKEAFSKFGNIVQVTQQAKQKTATVACGDIKTANSILEQKNAINMGESALKIELSKSNKCGELGLFLTGMASDTTEEDLKDFLSNYGSVTEFKMAKLKNDEDLYAIVKFEAGLSVRKLINEKQVEMNGEKIKVALKQQKLAKKTKPEKAEAPAAKTLDVSHPIVNIKGIFLKKDEAAIVKLLEKFGKMEDSKFFTRDLEKIPPNAAKLTGKERKKIVSRAEIQFKKHASAIAAIAKEHIVHKGHNISINHKQGTGPETFKTKLAEKMAAKLKEKAVSKKPQFAKKPQGDLRRVIGFNTAMKRDNRGAGMWQNQNGGNGGNVWQNGRGAGGGGAPPFHKDFRNQGPQDNFSVRSGMNMDYQNMEIRMREQLMNQNTGGSSFFSGYGGEGNGGYGAGGEGNMNGGGWRNDNQSGGMWSRRDEGMSQNGGGMGQNGGGMGQNGGGMGYNGGMGQNGGGRGQNGGGIDMRKKSKFGNDFTSVTGMSGGPAKESFPNKPSRFDSGMSSQRMGTDFNLGSSSSMSSARGMGSFGGGYGMGGGGAFGGRQGGMGGQGPWGNGSGGGRFSQEDGGSPRKMRRF